MLHTCSAKMTANAAKKVRHCGADTVVVPVVMIVEGVLNGALVTQAALEQFPEAWNGRPVPVYHPEENGEPISANRPDVIDAMSVGTVFNARVEGNKLCAELWINSARAQAKGVLVALEAGEVLEVSTGYFSAREDKVGEFNGTPYQFVDHNLIPDHLALLPDQEGACSTKDGCGTRTPNVFQKLAAVFGLRNNQEGATMCTNKERAEKLAANAKLSPAQLEMLMAMDGEQLAMLQAIASGMATVEAPAPEEMADDETPEEPMDMAAVTNAVRDQLRRETVVDRVVANSACTFERAELMQMSVNALEKYEVSIRPVDYSGASASAPVTHAARADDVLTPRAGVTQKRGAN